MRKVNTENITKPVVKVIMEVLIPLNDGTGACELVQSHDLAYMDESHGDIMKMCKSLFLDAKQVAHHHIEIIRIRQQAKTNIAPPPPPPVIEQPKPALEPLPSGNDNTPAKSPRKKAKKARK